jgi:hypothetical protein
VVLFQFLWSELYRGIQDPEGDPNNWSKSQYKWWLLVRGLLKMGTMINTKSLISNHTTNESIPPITKKKDFKVEKIMDLVKSTREMIQILMEDEVIEEENNNLDAVIQMFLVHFNELAISEEFG